MERVMGLRESLPGGEDLAMPFSNNLIEGLEKKLDISGLEHLATNCTPARVLRMTDILWFFTSLQ